MSSCFFLPDTYVTMNTYYIVEVALQIAYHHLAGGNYDDYKS
jgi:hypothetical protein